MIKNCFKCEGTELLPDGTICPNPVHTVEVDLTGEDEALALKALIEAEEVTTREEIL